MKNLIAITGATGFIGHRLVKSRLATGEEVRCLSRTSSSKINEARFFNGDVNSPRDQLLQFLANVNILYHCAGEVYDQSLMRNTHVNGTANLLTTIQQLHLQSQNNFHWVQLSSVGAYGQAMQHPSVVRHVDENSIENPSGEYESTKTEADQLIIDFSKKNDWFKYTIVRPTNVFGVGMRSRAIVNMARMIQKKLFFYVSHNQAIANFVHVDDVVRALMLCADNPKAFNQTFIVSNDSSLQDVINKIADALNVKKPSVILNETLLRTLVKVVGKMVNLPLNNSKIDVLMRKTYYSNEKIKTSLGWQSGDVLAQLNDYMLEVTSKKPE